MDYSSLPNDPENPAGSSPWQSSPAPDRSSFERTEQESVPASPLPDQSGASAGPPATSPSAPEPSAPEDHPPEVEASDQDTLASPLPEEEPIQDGTNRASVRTNNPSLADIRFQGPPLTEEELRQKQLQQQRQQERYQQALHAQQHQRGPGPNRYHQTGRQGQRAPPQYKLQAKITGIERTGKKDPAIRFDVHVSLSSKPVLNDC